MIHRIFIVYDGLNHVRNDPVIDAVMPTGPAVAFAMHFTTAELPARDPNLLIEMFSPLPIAVPHVEVEGPVAEALRLSLEPAELVTVEEFEYVATQERIGVGNLHYE